MFWQDISIRLIVTAGSSYATWLFAVWLLGLHDPHTAVPLATILIVSSAMHEISRSISLRRHGMDSWIVLLLIFGGTRPITVGKFDTLRDSAKAEIALAGMFGNLAVVLGAMALYGLGVMSGRWAGAAINVNASLMLFNMVPVASFDGSRFVTILFHNIAPGRAQRLFDITSLPVIMGFALLLYVRGSIILALPLILIGWRHRMHYMNGARRTGTMTSVQRTAWAIVYAFLVVAAVLAYGLTPDWTLD